MAQYFLKAHMARAQGETIWKYILEKLVAKNLTSYASKLVAARLVLLVLSFAGFVSIAWLSSSIWISLAACVGLAFSMAQWAFFAHDAGHSSLLARRSHNRFLGQIAMTVVAGLAFDEWITRHKTHHQFCQNESRDPDMDVSLVASLTAGSLEGKTGLGRLLTRCQFVHIWFLSLLFGHSQRHLSQIGALMKPSRFGLDIGVLALHFGMWFLLPWHVFDLDIGRILMVYLVPATLLGPYLAGIFWVNHIGMPLVDGVESLSFLEHQALTSRTIVAPKSFDWIYGGLNYQIEHHLYPQIPSYRLRSCQPVVRDELVKHGLTYHECSYTQALSDIASHFRAVSRLAGNSSR